MNNNNGVFVGIVLSLIITFLNGDLVLNQFFESLGSIIGTLIINVVITLIICLFKKLDDFGKIFGQVSIVLCLLTLISFGITASNK